MISSSTYYLYNNLSDFLYFSDIMSHSSKNLESYNTVEMIDLTRAEQWAKSQYKNRSR